MATPMTRPLAEQRILTRPPPERPSTSRLSSLPWVSVICFWMVSAAAWAALIISSIDFIVPNPSTSLTPLAAAAELAGLLVFADFLRVREGGEDRFHQRGT